MKLRSKIEMMVVVFLGLMFSVVGRADEKCNVYIDKVLASSGPGAAAELSLWLKTANLDSKPKSVTYQSQLVATKEAAAICASNPNYQNCPDLGVWKTRDLKSFFADDYFQLTLFIDGENAFKHDYEGVFVVTTESGREYFARSATELGNFYIDTELHGNLTKAHGVRRGTDITQAVPTKEFFPYLNPDACPN